MTTFKKGQTLIELLAVMVVVVLIVLGLLTLSRQNIQTQEMARASAEATKISEDGIEKMYAVYYDQGFDWLNGSDGGPSKGNLRCYVPQYNAGLSTWSLAECSGTNNLINPSGSNITFTRKIGVFSTRTGNNDAVCVDVVVFWQDQKGVEKSISQTLFTRNDLKGGGTRSGGCSAASFIYP